MQKFERNLIVEWAEKVSQIKKISGIEYWNKRAEDYNDFIQTSNYEHGQKIKEIFQKEGILKSDFDVLDIAAGPGSVTIPFAESVKRVVAVEPAKEMCKCLTTNSMKKKLTNIEIINNKWENINIEKYKKSFDLVICSHALWHFPDISNQLKRMNTVSRNYCCVAESVKNSYKINNMYKILRIPENFDYFIYLFNILYKINIITNIKIIETNIKRSIKSEIHMWKTFISKYRPPTKEDEEIILEHVEENSKNGIYERKNTMAVLWWNVNK